MSLDTTPVSRQSPPPRRPMRVLAVLGGSISALIIWFIADKMVGLDLHQPAFGPGVASPLQPAFAAGLAGTLALAGWGLLSILEHFSARGGRNWLYVALIFLVFSLGNPLSGQGISQGNRLALIAMHLAAGAIVIPLLYMSSTRRGGASAQGGPV